MTNFKAEVTENIPAYRLIGLKGVGSGEDYEENWEDIQLKLAQKGWIPDFVSTAELTEGDVVKVTISDKPVWEVESSEDIPAGSLTMCDDDGRVKHYVPADGSHFGYTIHYVKAGEPVKIVRKYGYQQP